MPAIPYFINNSKLRQPFGIREKKEKEKCQKEEQQNKSFQIGKNTT
jgi:hypothetical protein